MREVWETSLFKSFWKVKAPQKVLAFSWKEIKNRIPTKESLNKMRVLGNSKNLFCVFCNGEIENTDHIFIQCKVAYKVWMKVYGWIGLVVILPSKMSELYLQHMGSFGKKYVRKRELGVWHAVVWSLWLERNDIIFKNGEFQMGRVIEMIKFRSWSWMAIEKEWKYHFVRWCMNPLECMKHKGKG